MAFSREREPVLTQSSTIHSVSLWVVAPILHVNVCNGQRIRKTHWYAKFETSCSRPNHHYAPPTASQNETALQNLFYGQTANVVLAFILRLLFGTLLTTKKGMFFYTTTGVGSQYLYTRLKAMGTPKRDASGTMISPGEDLNQPGVTEWMFDVLYISCTLYFSRSFLQPLNRLHYRNRGCSSWQRSAG